MGDRLSWKDENLPYEPNDSNPWSVAPDWEAAQVFYIIGNIEVLKKDKIQLIFSGITRTTTEAEHKWAAHQAKAYFTEDDKIWKLGGATPSHAVFGRECVTKQEATQLIWEKHKNIHLHQDLIKIQLLN